MRRHGACGLAKAQHTDPFEALVRAIISQQLSTRAAATIAARFEALFDDGHPTPARVAAVSDERLRGCGLSTQKLGYIRDLCLHIENGSLPLDALDRMSDDDVIEALTRVKGIGRWTAEMFLIFHLKRPDILPLDDLGLLQSAARHFGWAYPFDSKQLEVRAEAWRPWRTVGVWYLWRALDPQPVVY